MTPQQYQKVKDLFQEIIDTPVSQRQALLDKAAQDDQVVLQEVSQLLAHHDPQNAHAEGNQISKRSRAEPRFVEGARASVGARKSSSTWKPIPLRPKSVVREPQLRWTPWYLLVPLLMLTMLGVGVWIDQALRTFLTGTSSSQLSQALQAAASVLEASVREQQSRLQVCVREVVLVEHVLEKETAIERALDVLQRSFPEDKCYLCDATAKILVSTDPSRIGSRIESEWLGWFSEGMASDEPLLRIEVCTNDLPRQLSFCSIRKEANERVGLLVIESNRDFTRFADSLKQFQFNASGEVYAVAPNGCALSNLRDVKPLEGTGFPLLALRAGNEAGSNTGPQPEQGKSGPIFSSIRIVDPGEDLTKKPAAREYANLPLTTAAMGIVSIRDSLQPELYRNYVGKEVFGCWKRLPRLQLGLIVEVNQAEVLQPLKAIRQGMGIAGGSVALAGLLGLAWAWRSASQRQMRGPVPVLGAYELLEPLASGGMGTVYRARHSLLKRPSAIKVIRADRLSPEDIARFDREVRVAARLHSPHTISIFDYGQDRRGIWYFAMELLDGLTLDKVIARFGPLSVPRTLYIWEQICQSLQEAHQQGLVHRDIKPQNIMLSCRGGSPDFAIVFDFGLAKPMAADSSLFVTEDRIWVGTPIYMPPERIRNPLDSDPRSDLYSTGVLAYYLLVGHEPFLSSDPAALFEQIVSVTPPPPSRDATKPIPSEVDALILCCLEKDAANRPQTAEALRDQLAELLLKYPWNRQEAMLWWQK